MKKNCKISNHMKQIIDYEVTTRGIKHSELYREILNLFINVYELNGGEKGYIDFINREYLLFITNKYNGVNISHKYITINLYKEQYDMYIDICKDFPKYKVRLFELACFYYFNIIPTKLR